MKKLLILTLIVLLILPALYLASPSFVHAADMICESPITVLIDVKPGDSVNKINLSTKGLLPVAVLNTPEFDASQFIPVMAHLSEASMSMDNCTGTAEARWNYDDVNNDGLLDLVFFFPIQNLDLTPGNTEVMLMAHDANHIHIMGMDMVFVKP